MLLACCSKLRCCNIDFPRYHNRLGISKMKVSRMGVEDYNRAVHVWIFAESTQELLLQLRSAGNCQESWPGLWNVSTAGQIAAGDSSLVTARRKLQKELGVILPKDAFEMIFDSLRETLANNSK
ncbi:nudix hydrolase 3-like isoform X2 [Cucumis melo var. makuwa]|uniref:Nudix hydrolase 3-like isoform X2 n=1 Tax=Cucumis melo var. makuwa TaxID=1194695 RepID=A0A5A7UWY3_CUCMM|nr:nudix hydrolase 3-like isoform X2 [Cucumis melo var. makuwa]TYK10502.1 nudix hydrolase 3-like isoform X2 [Cucumis melo var. makuwa]